MDEGSDLFTGSTTTGGYSQPFYFVSNNHPNFEYGPGAFDHQKNFKAIFTYELPFLKNQKGFLGRVLGGWQLSAFYQGYSGHPIDVYSSRSRYVGNALDPNGYPENIGGDYNLDGVANDRPYFIGSSAIAFIPMQQRGGRHFHRQQSDRLRLPRREIHQHRGVQCRLRREHAELAVH